MDKKQQSLAQLRQNYRFKTLSKSDAKANPF